MSKIYTYKEICEQFLEEGGKFHTFNDFEYILSEEKTFLPQNPEIKNQKTIMMRHDVDADPHAAYEMAKIEHELGIRSTYFVLLTDTALVFWNDKEKRETYLKNFSTFLNNIPEEYLVIKPKTRKYEVYCGDRYIYMTKEKFEADGLEKGGYIINLEKWKDE